MQFIKQSIESPTWDIFNKKCNVAQISAKNGVNKISKLLDFHEELCTIKRDNQIEFELVCSCTKKTEYTIKFTDFDTKKIETLLSSYDTHCKVSHNVRNQYYFIHVQINA
jgi:hypothetical protein